MKKKLILLILFVFIVGIAACGKKQQSIEDDNNINSHIYTESTLAEYMDKMGITDIDQLYLANNRIYANGFISASDTREYKGNIFASINIDGSDVKSFSLANEVEKNDNQEANDSIEENDNQETNDSIEEYDQYVAMVVNKDNNFVILKNRYTYNNQDYSSKNHYSILIYSQDGQKITEYEIDDNVDKASEDYYLSSMALGKDNKIYIVENNNKILCLDENMQRQNNYDIPEIESINYLIANGENIYVVGWKNSDNFQSIWKLENDKNTFSGPVKLPSMGNVVPGDETYDFYFVGENEIKGWNYSQDVTEEVMNYIDSDIPVSYVNKVICVPDGFLMSYMNIIENKICFSKFQKIDEEKAAQKKIINLACRELNYQIKKKIYEFNRDNEEYKIKIHDYSQYNTADDYEAGLSKLNLDITAGKVPDILILDESMPLDTYIHKGILADLKPLMAASGTDMNELAPNAIKAYSKDEKLFCIIPSFYIQTYGVKQSKVGQKNHLSIADANELKKQLKEDASIFDRKTKTDVLREGLANMGGEWIDLNTGTCNFNSSGFIEFLEFANTFPEEITESDDYWSDYDSIFRNDRALLMDLYVTSFRDINYMEKGRMGEEMSIVGLPSNSGKGACIVPSHILAISDKSELKEGAWEFLDSFIKEDYQFSTEISGIPVLIKAIDKQAEEAQKKIKYIDDSGNEVEQEEHYFIGDTDIIIEPISKEKAKAYRDYIISVDQRRFMDSKIIDIINEEAASFFVGAKNAKEVAETIQGRVQIYVNENS